MSDTNNPAGAASNRCNLKIFSTILLFGILFQSVAIIALFERFQKIQKHNNTLQLQQFGEVDYDGNTKKKMTNVDADEDPKPPFFFSACLLIKDNNIILPEWLAYHYTVLPLRRLIVAVDPLSLTDPKSIFDLYETIGMNITVWDKDDSYWIDGRQVHEKKDFQITNDTDYEALRNRRNYRQKVFYKSCLEHLRQEKQIWTMLVDTDEFFVFNYYDENEGPPTWCRKNVTCAEEYVKSIKDGTHIRAKLPRSPSATVAEYIEKGTDELFDTANKPCVIFSRYLFVSKESSRSDEIQRGIGHDFNASLFNTFRYRERSPMSSMQMGKSLVDVSRYDGRDMKNIHRPLGDMCSGNNAYVHNAAMPFRVHHYIGSWETFRQPGFDARGRSHFDKRNNVKGLVVDNTTPRYSASEKEHWLTQFVKLVGKEKALKLTQNLRIREELEMERVIQELANGKQEHDWNKLNQKPGK